MESWQTQQQTLPPRHTWFVGMAVVVALCGSNKERHRDGFHLGSFLQGNKPHGSQPGGSNGHGMHCVGWCLAHPGPILFGHIVAKAFNVLACNDCLQVARASQVYLVNGILDCFLQIIGQAGLVKLLQDLDDGGACPFLGCLQLGTRMWPMSAPACFLDGYGHAFPNGLAPGQNLQLAKVEPSLALRSTGKLGLLAGA